MDPVPGIRNPHCGIWNPRVSQIALNGPINKFCIVEATNVIKMLLTTNVIKSLKCC